MILNLISTKVSELTSLICWMCESKLCTDVLPAIKSSPVVFAVITGDDVEPIMAKSDQFAALVSRRHER